MAPYGIINSTVLLNSPPTSLENNSPAGGVQVVPLGGDGNRDKDDDMFVPVPSFPYSLDGPPGGAGTTTVATRIGNGDEEEKTATGIPISIIWLPYVLFTLILISLMLASFCRYHRKHGHKYVRRREELAKKHEQAINQLQSQAVQNQVGHSPPGIREGHSGPGGGGGGGPSSGRGKSRGGGIGASDTLPPNGGPSSIEVSSSTTTSLSRQRNHHQHHNQTSSKTAVTKNRSPTKSPATKTKSPTRTSSKIKSSGSSASSSQLQKQPSHSHSQQTTSSKQNQSKHRTQPKSNKRHKPLTFTRNENGSMVDLRVEEKDKGGSTKMFKTPFYAHKPLSPWIVPKPGAYSTLPSSLPSPSSPLAGGGGFSDDDDDHSFLIHQTRL